MINLFDGLPALLAAGGRFQAMGRRFRADAGQHNYNSLFSFLMLIACATLVIWGLTRLVQWTEKHGKNSPRALFRELCRVHRIGWSERRMIKDLAEWQHLDQSAQVFLEPERFDAALLSPGLAEHRESLEALRDKIFGMKIA